MSSPIHEKNGSHFVKVYYNPRARRTKPKSSVRHETVKRRDFYPGESVTFSDSVAKSLRLSCEAHTDEFPIVAGKDAAHRKRWVRPNGHATLDRLRWCDEHGTA